MNIIKQLAKRILQYEARLVLKKYKPLIIAISGSVGKTVTREMVYSVLSKQYFVRKSEKSFTAGLGLPLTILGCSEVKGSILRFIKNVLTGFLLIIKKSKYPHWLILEIDFDKPGDLKAVSSFLQPDILIMTAISEVPSHIEAFQSIEDFMSEQEYLINSVKKDGLVIYNTDDSKVSGLLANKMIRTVSCGVKRNGDICAKDFEVLYSKTKSSSSPTGMSFEIINKGNKYKINIFGSLGIQNEYAALLAFAVGVELRFLPEYIASALNKYTSVPGRMKIIPGIKDTTIIDDSYNSSPIAVKSALEVFDGLSSTGKKIAVIGDMLELGKYSSDEHKKVASLLGNKISTIICVGIRARKIGEELLVSKSNKISVIPVGSFTEASVGLLKILEEGDIVLVKGSQAMRLEKVVESVMRHPEDKNKLLVRQESEWLSRG